MGRGGSQGEELVSRPTGQAAFDLDELRYLIRERLLLARRHPEADLTIYNYSNLAQYRGEWTETLSACRGLILNDQGLVIARGFSRFTDFRQPEAPSGPGWRVSEKHDGSLGILYRIDNQLAIATRGSFDSPQAIAATRMLSDYRIDMETGTTPLFEIIAPESRVVVDYGSRRELILLAAVDNQTGLDAQMPAFSGPQIEERTAEDLGVSSLEELAGRERVNAEGWVARWPDGRRAKVKFPGYLRLHRTRYRVDDLAVWDNLRHADPLESLLEGLPDESFREISEKRRSLQLEFRKRLDLAKRELADIPGGNSRRQTAEYFLSCQTPSGVLFDLLDGRDPEPRIWETLRPASS